VPRSPPLNAVRAFEAAARHASFKRAAEELNVTHGAISRQVALLEGWLGTALFRRLNRQVVLTQAGQTLYGEVSPALSRIAIAAASLTVQGRATTLVLNAPPTFTMRWLIPRLSKFLSANKLIEVRLETSLKPVDFATGGYDLAIRRSATTPAGLRSQVFLREMLTPVCSPDLARGGPMSLENLKRQTLIHTETAPSAWPEWFDRQDMSEFRAEKTVRFEELFFTLQAAMNGLGVAIAPAPLVTEDVVAGRLIFPFASYYSRNHDYRIVHADAPEKRQAIERFCRWIVEEGELSEGEAGRMLEASDATAARQS
jgi:LysR family transcriptional regulator, glycine cleavage system transcriptional activator